MQITSVAIWKTLDFLGPDYRMSLNDVCVFVPAWFGVVATTFLGLLTYECSRSPAAGLAAAAVMAVVPAHLQRSVGGGYDNESVAVSAMCATFWLWCRSLRHQGSWPIGAVAGLAYAYMVAAWGGYIFVVNMVGIHAAYLALTGRFTDKLHRAYSLFFLVGTACAVHVPIVGWLPLRSAEQLGPLAVFIAFQLYQGG